jgi:hypothetical protein
VLLCQIDSEPGFAVLDSKAMSYEDGTRLRVENGVVVEAIESGG